MGRARTDLVNFGWEEPNLTLRPFGCTEPDLTSLMKVIYCAEYLEERLTAILPFAVFNFVSVEAFMVYSSFGVIINYVPSRLKLGSDTCL